MYLKPATWQALGLSVGATYAVFGAFYMAFPAASAATLLDLGSGPALWPFNTPASKAKTYAGAAAAGVKTDTGADAVVRVMMPLLGVRDLVIATAIFALDYQEQYHSVGTVILAGMGMCVADIGTLWVRRGAGLGSIFTLGMVQWGLIGWGLQFWY